MGWPHLLTRISDSYIEAHLTVRHCLLLGAGFVPLESQVHALNAAHVWYYAKIYCIAGNIPGELNLADWLFLKKTAKLKSSNI